MRRSLTSLLLLMITGGAAQAHHFVDCPSLLSGSTQPTLLCSAGRYEVQDTEVTLVGNASTGIFHAYQRGLSIFEPDEPPTNIAEPFLAIADLELQLDGLGRVRRIVLHHRGAASTQERDVFGHTLVAYEQSRVTFVPVLLEGNAGEVEIRTQFRYDFRLRNPPGQGRGVAPRAGSTAWIRRQGSTEEFYRAIALGLLEKPSNPRVHYTSFAGEHTEVEHGTWDFLFERQDSFTSSANQGLVLSALTDQTVQFIERGQVIGEPASSSSMNSFTLEISSPNPDVRFEVSGLENEAPFTINAGLNDAWFNPDTSGQGFFITVFPAIQKMFLAMFTFETEPTDPGVMATLGAAGQRWFTAFGDYEGNMAFLDIEISSGGVMDSAQHPVAQTKDGTLTVNFKDCSSGSIGYHIPSIGLQGEIPIQRVADDNQSLCEALLAE